MKGTTAISKKYTGSHEFPHDENRQYMMILKDEGDTTMEFGNGGGKIPVPAFLEPYRVPISAMRIETTGSFLLVVDESTHKAAVAI